MSAVATRRFSSSTPAGCLRSITRLRLFRLTARNDAETPGASSRSRRVSSPPGGSILMTSAPMSASSIEQKGPAITCVWSSTRIPSSAIIAPESVPYAPLHHGVGMQPHDVGVGVAGLAEDLVGVLAGGGRHPAHAGAAGRELHRQAQQTHTPRHRVLDLLEDLGGAEDGVGQRLVERAHGG